jgi:hypothetical protein
LIDGYVAAADRAVSKKPKEFWLCLLSGEAGDAVILDRRRAYELAFAGAVLDLRSSSCGHFFKAAFARSGASASRAKSKLTDITQSDECSHR